MRPAVLLLMALGLMSMAVGGEMSTLRTENKQQPVIRQSNDHISTSRDQTREARHEDERLFA